MRDARKSALIASKVAVTVTLFAAACGCMRPARGEARPPTATAFANPGSTPNAAAATSEPQENAGTAAPPSPSPLALPQLPAPEAPRPEIDPFDKGVAQIRSRVPEWDSGTGIAIRYIQTKTGKRLTFLYVDKTAPEWKPKLKTWLVLSRATWDGEIVSTVAITLGALKAGRLEGAATKTDCIIGAAIGTTKWDPKDPSTAWSNNEGGFCEVELRDAKQPGHLEGEFKAKLVADDGVFYTIDEGFLYINR